ncbi:hypothetical protein GZ78_28220 [Endozoicomonas numazuensis]|uniref:Uncharacterized protein n=1 Tax=Endozoicomonas numazuensis TaxID=1137799 RepID=A0A081N100_9GAMM|nr:hypothetical protein GZ78_28220 [Endozoicomonas numazuensis]
MNDVMTQTSELFFFMAYNETLVESDKTKKQLQAVYRPSKHVFSALKDICRHTDTINGLESVSESLAGIHFWRKLCSNTRSDNYPTNLFEFIAQMREVASFTFLLQKSDVT